MTGDGEASPAVRDCGRLAQNGQVLSASPGICEHDWLRGPTILWLIHFCSMETDLGWSSPWDVPMFQGDGLPCCSSSMMGPRRGMGVQSV